MNFEHATHLFLFGLENLSVENDGDNSMLLFFVISDVF